MQMTKIGGHVAVAAAVLMAVAPPAAAELQVRRSHQGAVGICNGALPGFEGALRKRPMGIRNTGSEVAFVSCAPHIQNAEPTSAATPGAANLIIGFSNDATQPITVSCTLVLDYLMAGITTISRSVTIAPGSKNFLGFYADADNADWYFMRPGVSCALPPGGDINEVVMDYYVDIGA